MNKNFAAATLACTDELWNRKEFGSSSRLYGNGIL